MHRPSGLTHSSQLSSTVCTVKLFLVALIFPPVHTGCEEILCWNDFNDGDKGVTKSTVLIYVKMYSKVQLNRIWSCSFELDKWVFSKVKFPFLYWSCFKKISFFWGRLRSFPVLHGFGILVTQVHHSKRRGVVECVAMPIQRCTAILVPRTFAARLPEHIDSPVRSLYLVKAHTYEPLWNHTQTFIHAVCFSTFILRFSTS